MAQGNGTTPLKFFGAGRENEELTDVLSAEISRVMGTNDILNGPDVHEFEDRIARITGRLHCVAVGSATDALFFAMKAHGVGAGDEVLVPAYSFAASASAVVRAGASPVFVDVSSAHFTMDLKDSERRITPATKAILWVGLFGGYFDPAPIRAFAKAYGLALIEDAAQSFGASWDGIHAGALGDSAIFSFDRNKVLGAPGTGGALVTDSNEIAATARSLRYHGKSGSGFAQLGYNSQMSGVTATVLKVKLNQSETWRKRRVTIARAYDQALVAQPVTTLSWDRKCTHAYHKYVFVTENRSGWKAHLQEAGIPTRVHYETPLHREPVFEVYARNSLPCPVADALSETALSLPIYAQITDLELDHITTALKSYRPS